MARRTQHSRTTKTKNLTEELSESNSNDSTHSLDEKEGVDTRGVAQWIEEDSEVLESSSLNTRNLRHDIFDLPFGALRNAQNILVRAEAASDDSDYESEQGAREMFGSSKGKEKEELKSGIESRKTIAKRANKHAPIEVTSKRPVSRKRVAIDVSTLKPRDPRFLPLTGEFSATKFQQSYSFLIQRHHQELETLRDNLKRARKLLSSSPQDAHDVLANEVERLELAVKRAESLVNKDKRDAIEQAALAKMDKEERERRKHGKGAWYFKKSNKREMLMKARYEALASEGGTRAVKKAIEKRQKKIGQKEKKSRPYSDNGDIGRDRRNKRRRVV